MSWGDRKMTLVPEHVEKWLQQLGIFTLLTTLCDNVDENYTHRVTTWIESGSQRVGTIFFYSALEVFVVPTTLSGKQAGILRIVRERFTQFLACGKMSKSPKLLESSEFSHPDYIMQQNNECYTCYRNVSLCCFLQWSSHQREAARRKWIVLTTLSEKNVRKVCADGATH